MTAAPPATADLDWREGDLPVSRRYGDAYYGGEDGLAEARHVFLTGNDLPARFAPGFRIAELGFGTGLNVLAALAAWRAAGVDGPLAVTSFEAHPLDAADMRRALAAFPALDADADRLCADWTAGRRRLRWADLHLDVVGGDAAARLPAWDGTADAWFLDGFAPARNPAMWTPDLMRVVAARTAPGGTVATFTAAGAVRRALADAGFAVERRPGFGRKRHMTAGTLK